MREAVERAFRQVTGHDNEWMFSGWGADLSEAELAVTEDRLPRPRVIAAAARAVAEQAGAVIGTDLDPEAPERGWEIHEPDDRLRIELTQLRRWKAEAMTVLGEWDKVHAALGKPGQLGESMALASLAEINPLIAAPPAPAVPVERPVVVDDGEVTLTTEGDRYRLTVATNEAGDAVSHLLTHAEVLALLGAAVPVEQAGRRELDVTALPEWTAFIAAHDAATAVTTPQPGVQPEGASAARTALIHAAHRLARAAAAPSPATEPEPPMWSGSSPIDAMTPGWGQESDPCYLGGWRCSVCPVCPYNPAFTEAERNAAIAARTPPPPAAPAVSPEPERDEP